MSTGKKFASWPEAKRYSAALYFLSHVHTSPVSEAQWGRLNALQMQIAYGSYSESGPLPEFELCSMQEKKRREGDWKSVSSTPKHLAVRQFLDIMDNLFPSWHKTRDVREDFDAEWSKTSSPYFSFPNSSRASNSDLPTHTSIDKPSSLRVPSKLKEHRSADALPTAAHQLRDFEARRILSPLPKLPQLNASRDAASTVSRLKGDYEHRVRELRMQDSKYYKMHRSASRTSREVSIQGQERLAELYETLTSVKVASKREQVFMQHLEDGMASQCDASMRVFTRRLQSLNSQPVISDPRYPEVSTAHFESLLRPKLELYCRLLSDTEKVIKQEIGEKVSLLKTAQRDLQKAIDVVFEYLRTVEEHCWDLEARLGEVNWDKVRAMEKRCEELEEQLKNSDFQHLSEARKRHEELEQKMENLDLERDTLCITLEAIAHLYSRAQWESEAQSPPKFTNSEYQVQLLHGLTVLKPENVTTLQQLEDNFRDMKEATVAAQRAMIQSRTERDKLADNLLLLEASAERLYGKTPRRVVEPSARVSEERNSDASGSREKAGC